MAETKRKLQCHNSRRRSSAQSTAKAKRKTRKVVILGSSKSGKTALIKRYLDNTYTEEYTPTVEDCYNRDILHKGFNLNLDFLDMCELYTFPAMRDLHLKSANFVILTYEMEDKRSIKEVLDAYNIVKQLRHDPLPLVIVGTKLDLFEKYTNFDRYLMESEYSSILNDLEEEHILTSAKTNVNVSDAFEIGLDRIIRRIDTYSLSRNKVAELKKKGEKTKKTCCTVM